MMGIDIRDHIPIEVFFFSGKNDRDILTIIIIIIIINVYIMFMSSFTTARAGGREYVLFTVFILLRLSYFFLLIGLGCIIYSYVFGSYDRNIHSTRIPERF